jgi:signal transduction histidine kinase
MDRVEALGGTMTISSHPGNGTALRVNIPLSRMTDDRPPDDNPALMRQPAAEISEPKF